MNYVQRDPTLKRMSDQAVLYGEEIVKYASRPILCDVVLDISRCLVRLLQRRSCSASGGYLNVLLLACVSFGLWAGAPANAQAPHAETGEVTKDLGTSRAPYRIGIEDVIQVDVWKSKELSQEQTVRPDGKIAFKLVGEVHVEGMTVSALRDQLTELYREFVPAAEVSVTLKEINSFKVYILGRIQKPGEYKRTSGLTVLQALALAGPFLAYANVKEIKIFRRQGDKDQILTFNYKDVVKGLSGDMDLLPGDRLLVP